ncbi:MAG: DNA polymerase III subunit beta [Oscillospiraceae bacterium]|nr:DNA polymerase III subunit beta [Oscillospiraceae bacterium]
MRIRCQREELIKALSGVSRAVASRSPIPSIEGILFTVLERSVILTGYNLELGINTTISAVVEETGDIVINANLLIDMVRKSVGEEVLIYTDNHSHVFLQCGIAKFDFSGIVASDFPDLPNPETEESLIISSADMKEMIEMILFAVATDDSKPVYTGARFILEENLLTLVAVDGYRLAVSKKNIENSKNRSFIVPGKTLAEVSRLIDGEDDIHISTARRYAIFTLKDFVVTTRLLEGDFIDHTYSIPIGYKTRTKINVSDFYSAVERASLVISNVVLNAVKISFEDDMVIVNCNTPVGKSHDEISAAIEGDGIEMGFNSRYLMEALNHCNQDEVYLELNEKSSPIKIVPLEGDDFLYLVLPVRI